MDVTQSGTPGIPGTGGSVPGVNGTNGGAGGGAVATNPGVTTDAGNTATAQGGAGGLGGNGGSGAGTGGNAGAGGAGGSAAASSYTGVSAANTYSTARATGGMGGGAGAAGNFNTPSSGVGANAGAGGTATAAATGTNASGYIDARAYSTGGVGGSGFGAGQTAGAGGAASNTTASASGTNASALAYQTGGTGGFGTNSLSSASGANAGAGASSMLLNAVGGTATGRLDLRQTARGGAGGGAISGAGGAAGAAISSLTFGNTTASTLEGYSIAVGGLGGSGTGDGSSGGAATGSIALTGARAVTATGSAQGGGGGSGEANSTNGGAGGVATGSASATSTTRGSDNVTARMTLKGGYGGSSASTSGSGRAGGAGSGASATATEPSATGGLASAYAHATGGAGGRGTGAGQTGGAGGTASNSTASASGFNAYARAYQIGGSGGNGASGAFGGAGASSTLTNAATGATKGGYLRLIQAATGGAGGYGYGYGGGTAGTAGAGTSNLTFDDAANPTHARSVTGTSTATGGAGGAGTAATATAGGAGTASVALTGVDTVNATANANGGNAGGVGGLPGVVGGEADATSSATATDTQPAGVATAAANATGGKGSTQGAASATATASTANGQLAKATSLANGSSGLAQTTAITHDSGIATSVSANAQAPFGSAITTARTTSLADTGIVSSFDGVSNAYASATDLPNSGFVSMALSTHSRVNAVLGTAQAKIFGEAAQGGTYFGSASGPRDGGSSVAFTLDATTISGHLEAGLLDNQLFGTGFQTLDFSVLVGTTTVVAQHFTTVAAAQTYFSDDVLDLGAFIGVSSLVVTFNLDLHTSATGSGFGEDFLLGATQGAPPCYVAGTRIATDRGPVAVEHLAVGDMIRVVAGDPAGFMPATWIGQRRVDMLAHPDPALVLPIRIKAAAFAESLPVRDLLVSPDHAIFTDGVLVPARLLVNGVSIVQDRTVRSAHYFHVELARHAVILAEGLPAESYLDSGNRAMFANAPVPTARHADFAADPAVRAAMSCAELAVDAAVVQPIWARLAGRAGGPAMIEATSEAALRLLVGGRTIRPVSDDARRVFVLPRGATEVRLVSRAARPSDTRPWLDDRRRLGVLVRRIVLRDAAGEVSKLALDDAALTGGWWAVEQSAVGAVRWTDGEATLALPGAGFIAIEIELVGEMSYPVEIACAA